MHLMNLTTAQSKLSYEDVSCKISSADFEKTSMVSHYSMDLWTICAKCEAFLSTCLLTTTLSRGRGESHSNRSSSEYSASLLNSAENN